MSLPKEHVHIPFLTPRIYFVGILGFQSMALHCQTPCMYFGVDFPSNRTVCTTYLDVLIRERFRAVKGKKRRTLELKKKY